MIPSLGLQHATDSAKYALLLCSSSPICKTSETSCARGDTICSRPSPPPSCAAEQTLRSSTFPRRIRSCWPLQPPYALRPCWVKRPGDLDLDLESGVRVTSDVGYRCANFGVPIGLSVLDLGPMNATHRRQTSHSDTDVRQKHRLMPPPIRGGTIIKRVKTGHMVITDCKYLMRWCCILFAMNPTKPLHNDLQSLYLLYPNTLCTCGSILVLGFLQLSTTISVYNSVVWTECKAKFTKVYEQSLYQLTFSCRT